MLPPQRLARLVGTQRQLGRQVFVRLDSTEDFLSLRAVDALEIRAALKSCNGIFVHAMRDVVNLESFKLRRNVSFVPRREGGEAYLFGKMAWLMAVGRAGGA